MTKYYCDKCEKELSTKEGDRLKLQLGPFRVEVIVGLDTGWNNTTLCHKCIKEIIAKGKP